MDFTGTALYWNSQVDASMQELKQAVYGNPHCASPSSKRSQRLVEETRAALLEIFKANTKEYALIFTRSGTAALKMVGELFTWTDRSRFNFLISNHNSVLGRLRQDPQRILQGSFRR